MAMMAIGPLVATVTVQRHHLEKTLRKRNFNRGGGYEIGKIGSRSGVLTFDDCLFGFCHNDS